VKITTAIASSLLLALALPAQQADPLAELQSLVTSKEGITYVMTTKHHDIKTVTHKNSDLALQGCTFSFTFHDDIKWQPKEKWDSSYADRNTINLGEMDLARLEVYPDAIIPKDKKTIASGDTNYFLVGMYSKNDAKAIHAVDTKGKKSDWHATNFSFREKADAERAVALLHSMVQACQAGSVAAN
jgi:hypothetical protein